MRAGNDTISRSSVAGVLVLCVASVAALLGLTVAEESPAWLSLVMGAIGAGSAGRLGLVWRRYRTGSLRVE